MPKMTRDEMITWLINNDHDFVINGGNDWLSHILEFGFTGYANEPDNVLETEILERDPEAFEETDHA